MGLHRFKVVVAGAFGVGKTTFINHISSVAVVGTEAATSGHEATMKSTTTVGVEYGVFAVEDDDLRIELLLYGVPGQERFSFMWDIVGEGMDALLLLVDGTRPETWAEALAIGRHLRSEAPSPVVVGVNRTGPDDAVLDAVRAALPIEGAVHLPCDVVDEASARGALVALLGLLLDEIEASAATPQGAPR